MSHAKTQTNENKHTHTDVKYNPVERLNAYSEMYRERICLAYIDRIRLVWLRYAARRVLMADGGWCLLVVGAAVVCIRVSGWPRRNIHLFEAI